MSEAALEEELRQQCAELERLLRANPLSFENKTLGVQLLQMQDDYRSLQADFQSMRRYFGLQIAQLTAQVEEECHAATAAECYANSLQDLLHFHEDQGQHACSYWLAQSEKRDGSIQFLTLKLQECTIPSLEYRARRLALDSDASRGAAEPAQDEPVTQGASLTQEAAASFSAALVKLRTTTPQPPTNECYKEVLNQHAELYAELCRELQELEEVLWLEGELKACELKSAGLSAEREMWARVAEQLGSRAHVSDHSSNGINRLDKAGHLVSASAGATRAGLAQQTLQGSEEEQRGAAPVEAMPKAHAEAERLGLQAEVEACEHALAKAAENELLPPWASRCIWRGELDIRAGQLDRISLQFNATKRSLDAANEELRLQATSTHELHVRVANILRAVRAEEQKTCELQAEHEECERVVQELLQQSVGHSSGAGLPFVYHQWLLDAVRRDGPSAAGCSASGCSAAVPAYDTAGGQLATAYTQTVVPAVQGQSGGVSFWPVMAAAAASPSPLRRRRRR